MTNLFLDSSALVKRYIDEEGTAQVLDLLDRANDRVVSRLAIVEITSAVVRRARRELMSGEQVRQVLEALELEFRSVYEVVELGGAVITRATDLVRTHALRAADAIQLSSALSASAGLATGGGVVFVCSDTDLNAAAMAEGLRVLDPAAG